MRLKKIHPSYVFMGLVCGIVLGCVLATIFKIQFFSSFWWVVLAALVLLVAFLKSSVPFLVLAVVMGVILAFFRVSICGSEQEAASQNLATTARTWFSEKIKENLPEEESRLGLAYLLGMKSELGSKMAEVLRVVGLTHLIVASGTHLSIIIGFVRKIFGRISRFSGLFFSIFAILWFASMIGWTPSITRAALVTILSLMAWYVGRKFRAARLLLIVMAITLMINPLFLTDVGWLLSFASYAGITILKPYLVKFFYGEKKPPKISELILVTLAATLACTPILLYFFGSISTISIVANLLILPTMPLTMGLTFVTGVMAFWPFLAGLIGKVAAFLLDFHLFTMNFLGQQKMFLVTMEKNQWWVFLFYVPIVLFVIFVKLKAKLVAVTVGENIYIGGNYADQDNWTLDRLDETVDFGREAIKREKVGKRAGNQRGHDSGKNDSFDNAQDAKKAAAGRFKIKKHRKSKHEEQVDAV